jgi:hypothetical protein
VLRAVCGAGCGLAAGRHGSTGQCADRDLATQAVSDQRICGRREEDVLAAVMPADHVRRPPVLAPHFDDQRFTIAFARAAFLDQQPVAWQCPHVSPVSAWIWTSCSCRLRRCLRTNWLRGWGRASTKARAPSYLVFPRPPMTRPPLLAILRVMPPARCLDTPQSTSRKSREANKPASACLSRSLAPTGCRWVATMACDVVPFGAVVVTPSVVLSWLHPGRPVVAVGLCTRAPSRAVTRGWESARWAGMKKPRRRPGSERPEPPDPEQLLTK